MQTFTPEISIKSGRYNFNHFNIPGFNEMTKRKSEGMKECLGGGIDRYLCQRREGET